MLAKFSLLSLSLGEQQLPSFPPRFADAEGRSVENHRSSIAAQLVQKTVQVNLRLLDASYVFQCGYVPLQFQFKHLGTGANPLQRIATFVGQTGGNLRDCSQPFGLQGALVCLVKIHHVVAIK